MTDLNSGGEDFMTLKEFISHVYQMKFKSVIYKTILSKLKMPKWMCFLLPSRNQKSNFNSPRSGSRQVSLSLTTQLIFVF